MDFQKILGIILIILGLIFVISPMYSASAVSLIAGISLIVFGLASIIQAFSVFSVMAHISGINMVLGIFAVILGFLFIYKIDALSFIVAFQFYLIAIVLICVGILGIFSGPDAKSKIISLLIVILGIVFIYLATFSLAQPLFVAIIVGLCLILEGITFLTTNFAEN